MSTPLDLQKCDDTSTDDFHVNMGNAAPLRDQISIYDVENSQRGDPSGLALPVPTSESCCSRIFPAGTLLASGINFVKITLGTGTIGIPFAMMQAGGLLFIIYLILAYLGTVYSMCLLAYAFELTGMDTYELLGTHLIGRWMGYTVSILMILFCWGATVMYISAMGSILSPLQTLSNFPEIFLGIWGRRMMITIFWAVFMFPLCLPRQINTLRYSSLIGVIATIVLITAIVVHTFRNSEASFENISLAHWNLDMVIALPIAMFAYGPQTNCFEIYAELRPKVKSVHNLAKTCGISMGFCTLAYIICGLCGVASFGNHTKSNILDNYDPLAESYLIVPFVGLAVTLLFTFPVQTFPARDAVLQFLGYPNVYVTPSHVRMIVAGFLAVTAILIGIFVPKISILFGLVGGVCASTVCFVFPALFILMTKQWTIDTVGLKNVIPTWVMLILGSFAGIFSTAVTIYQMATGQY